jgi:hypothetical protein
MVSRVGGAEDPKLKLGENEKGPLTPRVETKETVKDVMIVNSVRSNPGLELAQRLRHY